MFKWIRFGRLNFYNILIMRAIISFFCAISVCVAGWAQQVDSPNREVILKILNKKGRPVRNIMVQSLLTGKAGFTDRTGSFVFEDISDNDTLSLQLKRNAHVVIPVTGLDSIVVMERSSKLYSYLDSQGQDLTVGIELLTTNNNTILDVQTILKQQSYSSLSELLWGRVPGLNISTASSSGDVSGSSVSARMGGPNTLTGGSEPLVVLDGVALGTIGAANLTVNIYSVKTIEVQKNASSWGVRGANGVILITSL